VGDQVEPHTSKRLIKTNYQLVGFCKITSREQNKMKQKFSMRTIQKLPKTEKKFSRKLKHLKNKFKRAIDQ